MHFELQQVSKSAVAAIDENLTSNAAAIILDDFIVAVDVTMRPDTSRLFRTMLEEKYNRPLRFVFVTHCHRDHVFGLKPYKDLTLFASAPIAANMRSRMETDWTPGAFEAWKQHQPEDAEWVDDVELIIPPVLFHHRMEILNNDRIVEFHFAGGHTSCSAYAYDPTEKILFAGDLIFADEVPYGGDETCDPEEWMAVLRTWLDLEIAKVVPGHGPLADKDEIRKHLEFFELLKGATIEAIGSGKSYKEIAMPGVYPVEGKGAWGVEKTRERWYEYYSKA